MNDVTMEANYRELVVGEYLYPGDEVLKTKWEPSRHEWGDVVGGVLRYRRRVAQNVDPKWLESKATEVKASLIKPISKEKCQYQIDAIRLSYFENMRLIIESYSKMAGIERQTAEIERRIVELKAEQTQEVVENGTV